MNVTGPPWSQHSVARVTGTMRSRSLHYSTDWIKFLGSTRKAGLFWQAARGVTLTIESSEDAEDDTGTGSAGQDAGADFRTHVPQGPLVAGTAYHRDPAHDLGCLCHRARFHRPLVLRGLRSLPDAFLLTVHQRRMRGRVEQPGPLVPGGAADHPVRAGVAVARARLPAVLLLLPPRVLPGILARARGLRGARAARQVHRRDQVPADHAEPAPVLLLRGHP